jgi:predicted nucleic acid-binding protein
MTEQLGWLDTNLFVHSLYPNDPHCDRCRAHLRSLRDGRAEGWIDATVVHELTYVLIRRSLFPTRETINQYVRSHLIWESIRADDKDGLLEALARWTMQGVGFVDAWLAVLGQRRGLPVCSVNEADFSGVPNTYRADTS